MNSDSTVSTDLASEVCLDCTPDKPSNGSLSGPEALPAPTESSSTTVPSSAPTASDDILPPVLDAPRVIIEFCDRCRWAPRATWTQTELFLSFPSPIIRSITLQPLNAPETGGRFRVWLDRGQGHELVWDRKNEGGFPELKVLKQRIRNLVQPDLDLGHSDVKR